MKKSIMVAWIFVSLVAVLILFPLEVLAKSEFLKYNQCRRAQGWSEGCVQFKANTTLELANNGGVISGTLANNACMRAQGWSEGCAQFKAGTLVTFNARGGVITGTVAIDSNLRPKGLSTAKTYKAGTTVTFNEKGEVVR